MCMRMTSYGAEAYLNVYNNYMRYIFVYIYAHSYVLNAALYLIWSTIDEELLLANVRSRECAPLRGRL